jgi:hypothetical protein
VTSRERAYNRKVQELIDRVGKLNDREVKRVLAILENARRDIAAAVATTEWKAHFIPQLKEAINRAIDGFSQQYATGQADALSNTWNAGIDMIDSPLQHAGIALSAPEISRTALEIMQGYSVDLIDGLSADALKKINSEITLGIMGEKPLFEVMKAIGRNMKDKSVITGIARRAEVIARTEMGRVNSFSRQARMEGLKGHTDPPLDMWKKWISSGKAHARADHSAFNGLAVPIDEDFPGGIPYPHAPGLSAADVVNCG